MCRQIKLSYGKLCISFIIVSILVLNFTYMGIKYDLDRFYQHDIDNLVWSNDLVPLLSPKDACPLGPNISGPEILVMVPSAIVNFDRRTAIRNSWANTSLVRSGKIKVIFVIGQNLHDSSKVGNSKQIIKKFFFHPLVFRITGLNLRASPMVTYCKKTSMIVIII